MNHTSDTALLIVNLGTPEAPTAAAVRRYLGEFLSDRRVVSIPPLFWKPLLHMVILPIRGPRSSQQIRQSVVAGRLSPSVCIPAVLLKG